MNDREGGIKLRLFMVGYQEPMRGTVAVKRASLPGGIGTEQLRKGLKDSRVVLETPNMD